MNLDKYIYQHIRKKNHSILIWFLFHTHIPSHYLPHLFSTFSPSSLHPNNLFFFLIPFNNNNNNKFLLLLPFSFPFQSIVTAHAPTIQQLTLLPSLETSQHHSFPPCCHALSLTASLSWPCPSKHCTVLDTFHIHNHGKTTMVLVIAPGNQYGCHLHPP